MSAAGNSSSKELSARLLERLPALQRLAGVAAPGGEVVPREGSQQQSEANIGEATDHLSADRRGAASGERPSPSQDPAEERAAAGDPTQAASHMHVGAVGAAADQTAGCGDRESVPAGRDERQTQT